MRNLLIAFLLLMITGALAAQSPFDVEQGMKPYGSFQGGDIDSVNLYNGNVTLHIPLVCFPQRGKSLRLCFQMVSNNKGWYVYQGTPESVWSYSGGDPAIVMDQGLRVTSHTVRVLAPDDTHVNVNIWSATTPDGAVHQLNGESGRALDASGIIGSTAPDGTVFGFGGNATDTNGNQITGSSSGWTDTIGRTIPGSTSTNSAYGDYNNEVTIPGVPSDTSTCPAGTASALAWDLPAFNSGTAVYKICYADFPYQTNFTFDAGYIAQVSGTRRRINAIVLPNQTMWTFSYDSYLDISSIGLPTGGNIGYTWEISPVTEASMMVTSRTVNANDGTGSHTWNYAYPVSTGQTVVTDPNGKDTVHTFAGAGYESEADYYDGTPYTNASVPLLKSVVTQYSPWQESPYDEYTGGATWMNAVPLSVSTCLPATGSHTCSGSQTSEKTYSYDPGFSWMFYDVEAGDSTPYTNLYGSRLQELDYDFGAGAPGALLRQINKGYAYGVSSAGCSSVFSYSNPSAASYLSANILDAVGAVQTDDGSCNKMAETDYGYDGLSLTPSGISTQHGGTTPTERGNLTSTTRWLNTGGSSPVSYTYWYDTGVPYQSVDPKGNTTTYAYSGSFAGAYPTQLTNALNQNVSANYDWNTGLESSFTDLNSNTSTYSFDNMSRITNATFPDGGQTGFVYTDTGTLNVQRTRKQTSTTNIVDYAYFDGLGRTTSTVLVDPEGNDTTITAYDPAGLVASVSNPHRSTPSATDGTMGYAHDGLGRVTTTTLQDGNTTNVSYSGNVTTTTDETSRQRQSIDDGLAQLIEVIEPNPSTGSLTSGAYPTYYTYNARGDLTNVNQVGDGSAPRTRSFVYDSLSRLTSANNPESGQTLYSYSLSGSLCAGDLALPCTKTDARGVTLTYQYDQLNRITYRFLPNGGQMAWWYDLPSIGAFPISNSIGRLVNATNYVNADHLFSYDVMGRIVSQANCLPSDCTPTSNLVGAQYNLVGDLISLTYPSGRKVTHNYDLAGRLSNVNFDSINGTVVNYPYLTVSSHIPTSVLGAWSIGSGVIANESYNNRLQLARSTAGTPVSNYYDKTYSYVDGSGHNNGDVLGIIDQQNWSGPLTAGYNYDQLNRLNCAGTWNNVFQQCFTYDPWGNLKQAGTPTFMPAGYDANNRLLGYTYDAAGNVLNDSFHAYSYDAQNRVYQVDSGATQYVYDAEGNRVEKISGGAYTDYVYFGGQVVAEKQSNGDWSDYVYADGRRIAKADSFEDGIELQGTNCSSCGWQPALFTYPSTALNGYTIQSGDKFFFRQYQTTGQGGMTISFSDGSTTNGAVFDSDGQAMDNDTLHPGGWHMRSFDLSGEAGKTISSIGYISEGTTPPGAWAMVFAEVSMVQNGAALVPLYNAESSVTLNMSDPGGGVSGMSYGIRHLQNVGWYPWTTTNYYHSDHLGNSRMMTGTGGWPIWEEVFAPFGQEVTTQFANNHYKFTAKERDSESNLDYFGARYYSSVQGRFMSPDFSDSPEPVPYADLSDPQSLNLYGYVRNNPMSRVDADGHAQTGSDGYNDSNASNGTLWIYRFDSWLAQFKHWWNSGDGHPAPMSPGFALGGVGHHYIPRALFRNWEPGSYASRFAKEFTSGSLTDKTVNFNDNLHRAYSAQVEDEVEKYLAKTGKSAEDLTTSDFKAIVQAIKNAEGAIANFTNRLVTANPEARSLEDGLEHAVKVAGESDAAQGLEEVVQQCESGGCPIP